MREGKAYLPLLALQAHHFNKCGVPKEGTDSMPLMRVLSEVGVTLMMFVCSMVCGHCKGALHSFSITTRCQYVF